jgi:hypothetical protein
VRHIGILALLLLASLAAAVPAQADTLTTVLHTPIEGVLTAGCANAEPIAFSGSYRSVTHYTLDAAGNAHFSGAVSASGAGVGLVTGSRYSFGGASSSSTQTASGDVASHESFTNTFLVIGAGSAPNFRMHVTQHATVTPAGILAANVENIRLECSG